jgi:hypothetical protein
MNKELAKESGEKFYLKKQHETREIHQYICLL